MKEGTSPMVGLYLQGALLFNCANAAIADDAARAEECRTPPRLIVSDSKYEYLPPSTAMPPTGIVVLEVTVRTDGTIQDAVVLEAASERLQQWAIEDSKRLRFEPIGKACRTTLTLDSRITSQR